jgi:hypothetical protein
MRYIVVLLALSMSAPVLSYAADPDWKAVEQALGKSGQLQAGDAFRVGMPRTDLTVTVKGVPRRARSRPAADWQLSSVMSSVA